MFERDLLNIEQRVSELEEAGWRWICIGDPEKPKEILMPPETDTRIYWGVSEWIKIDDVKSAPIWAFNHDAVTYVPGCF